MQNSIEESVQVEMVREDFKVLLKIFFESDIQLSKSDYAVFKELIERTAKQYGAKNLREAYEYFYVV